MTLAQEECIIGRFLRECSRLDPTKAGKLMSGSGKTLLFSSHQTIALRVVLLRIYRDLQTFQYRAVADTFDTIERMEKARTAYRAALLWMKDLSKELDPEAYGRMDKFKRVQEHVRSTRAGFEKLKGDSIQKIDLLSASRTNLFSNIFASYQNSLKSLFGKSSKTMNVFVETFKTSGGDTGAAGGYDFQVLKELNNVQTVDAQMACFESRLKEILEQDNINEKDMLLFFEKDYNDQDKKPERSKSTGKSKSKSKTEKKLKDNIESLLDLTQATLEDKDNFTKDSNTLDNSSKSNLDILSENHGTFLPSSLIDLRGDYQQQSTNMNDSSAIHKQNDDFDIFDQLISNLPNNSNIFKSQQTSQNQQHEDKASSETPSKTPLKSDKNLDWLSFFSDIDPLSSAQEFDKISGDKKNC